MFLTIKLEKDLLIVNLSVPLSFIRKLEKVIQKYILIIYSKEKT
jgi:hypothetical protein